MTFKSIIPNFLIIKPFFNKKNLYIWCVIIIVIFNLFLRFYRIENRIPFNWDQGRDAQVVRDILKGKLTLTGPRTGIGEFHLGPLYYYFLVPFFFVFNMDPMASNYFNLCVNLFNIIVIYFVLKHLFGSNWAILGIFLYSINIRLIHINQIPWNVSMMPGLTFLLINSLNEALKGKVNHLILLFGIWGLLFHIHFTAILLLFLILPSMFFIKRKARSLKQFVISFFVFIIFFLPTIAYTVISNNDIYRIKDFVHYYYIGFHFRFLLHRLPDVLIIFESFSFFPILKGLKYFVPLFCVLIVIFFEKSAEMKRLVLLCFFWLLAILCGFTLYGGPVSDYYFLITLPSVLIMIIYLLTKLSNNKIIFSVFFVAFLIFYSIRNLQEISFVNENSSLAKQKREVEVKIKNGEILEYKEGDIKNYIYNVWKDKQNN